MYRAALFIFAGLTIAAVGGCSNQTEVLYQQATSQLAAQSDSINALRVDVESLSDSMQMAMQQAAAAEEKVQILSEENQKASKQIATLSGKIRSMKGDYDSLQELSWNEIVERDSLIFEINALFSDTNVTLKFVRDELGNEKLLSQMKSDLAEKIKPWYKKWKHDATKRSFLQVLFASGKAKKPEYPEPNIDTTLMLPIPRDTVTTPRDSVEINEISWEGGSQWNGLTGR